jgi:hypothetical protein
MSECSADCEVLRLVKSVKFGTNTYELKEVGTVGTDVSVDFKQNVYTSK